MKKRSEFEYSGSRVKRVKRVCDKLAKIVPELSYILPTDYMVVICNHKEPKSKGRWVVATMEKIPKNLYTFMVETLGKKPLPTYLMRIFPIFFKKRRRKHVNRVKDLCHELFHIDPSKKFIRDHVGFGDEPIERFVEANRKKIDKLEELN